MFFLGVQYNQPSSDLSTKKNNNIDIDTDDWNPYHPDPGHIGG